MTPKPPPFAVIFDFDGVLFETEPTHCDALAVVLSQRGITLGWNEYSTKYVGLSDREILDRIGRGHPALRNTPMDELLDEKCRDYFTRTKSGIPPIPGVANLIADLHAAGIPMAICSGSHRPEIDRLLALAKLARYFETIVTTEDVAASKPSPEGYLLAFERLCERHPQLSANRCIVFEDAAAGIIAARGAGMHAIALRKDYGEIDSAGPDAVIESFSDVTVPSLGRRLHADET